MYHMFIQSCLHLQRILFSQNSFKMRKQKHFPGSTEVFQLTVCMIINRLKKQPRSWCLLEIYSIFLCGVNKYNTLEK